MAPYFYKLGQLKWSKDSTKYASLPASSPALQDRGSMEDGPEVGLLEKGDESRTPPSQASSRPIWKNGWFLMGHIALFCVYVLILFLVTIEKAQGARFYGMPFSPARDVVSYQESVFTIEDHVKESPYTARPGPDVDKAWHDLLQHENILIEKEYIEHYNKLDTAVEIPEGGMYLGTLNVYHEIHCLKRLYQYMYPEYYFPDITEAEKDFNRLHNAHCIEFLRQSAICHGDIGLILYSWHPKSSVPAANATSHQCVDWDNLMGFTADRSVDIMKPGWLVHPTKGPAYPDGEGDKLGAPEGLSKGHQHGH